jgi:tetratricopeptide (TPR) repeat protein
VRLALTVLMLAALAGTPALAAVPTFDMTKVYPSEAAFASAIKVYQDALAANPKDADAAYWLGNAYWSAAILYRNGAIGYGADYLDQAIDALERAVSADDGYLAAWQLLAEAYSTRHHAPGATDQPAPSDEEKSLAATRKILELSRDPQAANRGLPRPGARNGVVPVTYQPLPDRTVRYRPADFMVIGDADTKLLYRYPCASLPAIKRPMLFLTKWEAINRGFSPATVCPPL